MKIVWLLLILGVCGSVIIISLKYFWSNKSLIKHVDDCVEISINEELGEKVHCRFNNFSLIEKKRILIQFLKNNPSKQLINKGSRASSSLILKSNEKKIVLTIKDNGYLSDGIYYKFYSSPEWRRFYESTGEAEAVIKIKISTQAKVQKISKKKLSINILVTNNSKRNIRILDDFSLDYSVVLTFVDSKSGKEYELGSHAKVDFGPDHKIKYIDIKPGQGVVVTLKEMEESLDEFEIPKGKYSVTLTYTNIKGENCVNGSFKSQKLTVECD